MEITECKVRAVGWKIKQLLAELLQVMRLSSRVWPSVTVQQDKIGSKQPSPLVFNGFIIDHT